MVKKIFSNSLILMIIGAIAGVISKYCDDAPNKLLYELGTFTSGLTLWLFVFTAFIYCGSSKKQSMKYAFCFMSPMLATYYLYSNFVCGYLYIGIVFFWIAMLILSLVLINFIWRFRCTNKFKYLFVGSCVICMAYDFLIISGASFSILITEIVLAVVLFKYINSRLKNKNECE